MILSSRMLSLDQLLDVTTDEAEKENLRNRAIDYTKRKSINFIGVKKERGAGAETARI